MATPTPRRTQQLPTKPTPEVVDPRWLLKALALTLATAVALAYLSVCLLIYQGGWQRLLHPSPAIDQTPAQSGIPFEPIRFDAATTGTPRLTAWWSPAQPLSAVPAAPTILFLHDATGSLSSANRILALLHRANVNIFAIDYRGYGQSQGPHPTEARMTEDASAALDYLVNTRHISPATVVPYGLGLGAPLAVALANAHPELTAVIVDQPDPEAFTRIANDSQSRFFPMHLLLQDKFDIRTALAACHKPKLLLADSPFGYETARLQANQAFFAHAPDPKLTVSFQHPGSEDAYLAALRRFLDENLRQPTS